MATCAQCGKEFDKPFGELSLTCPDCTQAEASREAESEPSLETWLAAARRRVVVAPILIGANILVFGAMAAFGLSLFEPTSQQLLRWGADFGPATLAGEWWRLLSCTFVHVGLVHLALNMWCLWDLGRLAEQTFGRGSFLLLYLLSGLGGSLTSLLWHPLVVSAGASGAIFGVAGGLVTFLSLKKVPAPASAVKKSLTSLAVFVGYNILYGLKQTRIDNAAHLGGLVTGLAIGALLPSQPMARSLAFRRRVALVGAGIGILLLSAAGVASRVHGPFAHLARAERWLAAGQAERAIEELKALVARKPDVAAAHFMLGGLYLEREQHDEAIASLREAVRVEGRNVFFWNNLGVAYLRKQALEEARAAFQKALELNPNFPDAHHNLGLVDYLAGRYDNALAYLRKASELAPNDPTTHWLLGETYLARDSYALAITALQRAVTLKPDFVEAHIALGTAYLRNSQYDLAVAALEKALALDPDNPQAQVNLSLARAAQQASAGKGQKPRQ